MEDDKQKGHKGSTRGVILAHEFVGMTVSTEPPHITLQEILGVVTERENKLVSDCLGAHKTLYYAYLRSSLLDAFGEALEALHAKIKAEADLITTMPLRELDPLEGEIAFRVIFASKDNLSAWRGKLELPNITVHRLPLGDEVA